MIALAVLARLALAAVFGLAGAAKLADRDTAEAAAIELGSPPGAARFVVVALSVTELVLAALLLVPATAHAAAAGVALLSLVLAVVVGVAVAQGRRPECRCFGELSAKPIGPLTLVRNLVLAGVAAALAAGGSREDPVSWVTGLSAIDRLTLAVAALALAMGALAYALLRAHGRLLLRVDALESRLQPRPSGLPVGSRAPELDVADDVRLEEVIADAPQTLLVFSDTRCGPCHALLPDIGRWQRELSERIGVVLVSGGSAEDVGALAREHGLRQVLLDPVGNTLTAYRVSGTPSAVLVDREGRVAAPPAQGAPAIASLVLPPTVVQVG
jgi:hypothetical protein